jgi:hypothetical protein
MKKYFQTKVKYTIQKEDGTFKKVTNQILIESDSFTLTEAIVTKELEKVVKGDFSILEIKRFEVEEIIVDQELIEELPFFFIVKGQFSSMNDDGEPSKKVSVKYLVQQASVEQASKIIMERNKQLAYFEVTSCVMSPLQDVILLNEFEANNLTSGQY